MSSPLETRAATATTRTITRVPEMRPDKIASLIYRTEEWFEQADTAEIIKLVKRQKEGERKRYARGHWSCFGSNARLFSLKQAYVQMRLRSLRERTALRRAA